jgi:hypothetical protein
VTSAPPKTSCIRGSRITSPKTTASTPQRRKTAATSSSRPFRATMTIRREDQDMIISWEGSGVLESAEQVNGSYTGVNGATSPYVTKPVESARFYRVRQ